MRAMTDQSAIDMAVKRLALALDALDAAVERRQQADRSVEALAAALDGETARSRRLETTNREIAQRLDTAIASIQSVLDANE
jgi:ATP/maltotriose-dependent transcriptional regulator MalT